MKYGLEVEFFAKRKGAYVDASQEGLPHDEWPLIVEARGLPCDNIFQAVASVRGEINRILSLMREKGLTPEFINWLKKDKVAKLTDGVLRRGVSKTIRHENMFGLENSKMNDDYFSAGLHVSFTNPQSVGYSGGVKLKEPVNYNHLFDFLKIFRKISEEFAKDIDKASRVNGFYEMKSDGRVEFRSIPATLILEKDFDARLAKCLI